jgi:hypothetical protein
VASELCLKGAARSAFHTSQGLALLRALRSDKAICPVFLSVNFYPLKNKILTLSKEVREVFV